MSGQWLDVIVPVRNPGEPLAATISSLIAQSDRSFGVLLSDNYSTVGTGYLNAAQERLEGAGLTVRLVRPTLELGRVEHWNWAHLASAAVWLKPLFVGDTLAPEYVARLRERITSRPSARLVRCAFEFVTPAARGPAAEPPVVAERFSPEELLLHYPKHGNWLGGPINFAYERSAFRGAGGFAIQLPGAADLQLFVTIALRHGIEFLPDSLATFHLHEERFSHGIRGRRVNAVLEHWLILRQARNFCLENGLPWPKGGVGAGIWRELKAAYWHPLKHWVKERLELT